MSETPEELLAEGRRYVLEVGEYVEGKGFKVRMVFENHPGYFTGRITNDPSHPKPYFWDTDDQEEAEEWAKKISEERGISRLEHTKIVMSSIGAQRKAENLHATWLNEMPGFLLWNEAGVEVAISEENAIALYQFIGETLGYKYQDSCPECKSMLVDEHGYCEECGEDQDS